jgi:predicted transcriptional regulator
MNVKTAISMPEELFAKVNEIAEAQGLSRSGVIAQAVEAYVKRERARQITEKLNEVYADGLDGDEKQALRFNLAMMAKRAKEDPWEE